MFDISNPDSATVGPLCEALHSVCYILTPTYYSFRINNGNDQKLIHKDLNVAIRIHEEFETDQYDITRYLLYANSLLISSLFKEMRRDPLLAGILMPP